MDCKASVAQEPQSSLWNLWSNAWGQVASILYLHVQIFDLKFCIAFLNRHHVHQTPGRTQRGKSQSLPWSRRSKKKKIVTYLRQINQVKTLFHLITYGFRRDPTVRFVVQPLLCHDSFNMTPQTIIWLFSRGFDGGVTNSCLTDLFHNHAIVNQLVICLPLCSLCPMPPSWGLHTS